MTSDQRREYIDANHALAAAIRADPAARWFPKPRKRKPVETFQDWHEEQKIRVYAQRKSLTDRIVSALVRVGRPATVPDLIYLGSGLSNERVKSITSVCDQLLVDGRLIVEVRMERFRHGSNLTMRRRYFSLSPDFTVRA